MAFHHSSSVSLKLFQVVQSRIAFRSSFSQLCLAVGMGIFFGGKWDYYAMPGFQELLFAGKMSILGQDLEKQ